MSISEFCELHETEYMEILIHVSVRWLSLELCVTRILRLYEPLASYFKSASMAPYIFNVQLKWHWTVNCTPLLLMTLLIFVLFFLFKMKSSQGSRDLRPRSQTLWLRCTSSSSRPAFPHSQLSTSSFSGSSPPYICCMMRYNGRSEYDSAIFFPFWACCYLLGVCTAYLPHCFTPVNVCVRCWNSFASCVRSSWCQQHCRAVSRLMKFPLKKRKTIYQVSDYESSLFIFINEIYIYQVRTWLWSIIVMFILSIKLTFLI